MQPTERALDGVRVLDLSRILAGPYCTMMLGDLGAEVIKVERPGTRRRHPHLGAALRRRRERLLPLLQPEQEVDHRRPEEARGAGAGPASWPRSPTSWWRTSRPGLMKRFGLDYETLRELNPRLVYCSITAYGQDGPYRDRPGYDMVLSAVGGLMWITGERDGNPCKVGVAITDVLTGVYASGAITAALLWRERSGRGQYIDCSLLDVQVVGAGQHRQQLPGGGQGGHALGHGPRVDRPLPGLPHRRTGRSPSPWPTRSCGTASARWSAGRSGWTTRASSPTPSGWRTARCCCR